MLYRNEELAERQVELSEKYALRFFDGWHRLKLSHSFQLACAKSSLKIKPLSLLTVHQIETLDAIRVVTVAGRPDAGVVLFRTLYDAFLSMMAIGYMPGRNKLSPSLARRFELYRATKTWESLMDPAVGFLDLLK